MILLNLFLFIWSFQYFYKTIISYYTIHNIYISLDTEIAAS